MIRSFFRRRGIYPLSRRDIGNSIDVTSCHQLKETAMEIPKKVALVTGANKGIGREIARQLARLGLTVFAAARDPERGEASATGLREEGLDVRFVELDVTKTETILAAAGLIDGKRRREHTGPGATGD
jgi:hypothetical protein